MKVKIIILITIYLLSQDVILFSQETTIDYVLDKYGSYVEKLEFPLSGKSFDVMANNPYNHLNYPEIEINRYGGKVYSLENIKESDSEFFTSKKYRPIYAEDLKLYRASSNSTAYREGENFTAIAYNLQAYSKQTLVGWKSTIIILNKMGEIVKEFHHLDNEAKFINLTEDGQFLSYSFGGEINSSGEKLFQDSYHIYHVPSKELLVEVVAEKEERFNLPFIWENNFFLVSKIGYNPEKNKYKYYIYNCYDKKSYSKVFTKKEINNLHAMTDTSLSFKSDESSFIEYLFDRDFSQCEIKSGN